MQLHDEVYVINENGKDSGIHGVVIDVYNYGGIISKRYNIAINGDLNNTLTVHKEKLRKRRGTYSIGTKIKIYTAFVGEKTYIVSKIGHKNEVNLVNLNTGDIWDGQIRVTNFSLVTESELEELINCNERNPVKWEVVG